MILVRGHRIECQAQIVRRVVLNGQVSADALAFGDLHLVGEVVIHVHAAEQGHVVGDAR